MAKERVTVTFGGLDPEEKSIIIEAPIEIYKTVKTLSDLNGIEVPAFTPNLIGDTTTQPNVVVYVEKVQGQGYNKGGYYRYNYGTGSWRQVILGSHSHDNKQILDKITAGDIGKWIPIHQHPNVKISEHSPFEDAEGNPYHEDYNPANSKGYDANNGWLHLHKKLIDNEVELIDDDADNEVELTADDKVEYTLYSAIRHQEGLTFFTTWHRLNFTKSTDITGKFPENPNMKDIYLKIGNDGNDDRLYIFAGSKTGEHKVLMMEVVEGDGPRSEYNVNWVPMPESLPEPILDKGKRLYLSVDDKGNKEWINDNIPGQSFSVMSKPDTIEKSANNKSIIVYQGEKFNPEYDEILLFSGRFFLEITEIIPNEDEIKIITNYEGDLDIDRIYGLIIRDTSAKILSELTEDFVKKEDLVNGNYRGRGSSKKLKQELNKKADRDHIHTGYAHVDHSHDGVYAPLEHTHEEYITRGNAYRIMKDLLSTLSGFNEENPEGGDGKTIFSILSDIQTSFSEDEDLMNLLISKDEFNEHVDDHVNNIRNINSRIDNIIHSTINSNKVLTSYVDSYRQPKTLDVILDDIFKFMDLNEMAGMQTDEIELGADIEVGSDIGTYTKGSIIRGDTSVYEIFERILGDTDKSNKPRLSINNLKDKNYIEKSSQQNLYLDFDFHKGAASELELLTVRIDGDIKEEIDGNTEIKDVLTNGLKLDQGLIMHNSGVRLNVSLKYKGNTSENDIEYLADGQIYTDDYLFLPRETIYCGTFENKDEISIGDLIIDKSVIEDYRNVNQEITVTKGSKKIYIAVPKRHRIEIKEIIYDTFKQNIIDLFELKEDEYTKDIVGIENNPIPYRLYTYEFPFELEHDIKLIIRN